MRFRFVRVLAVLSLLAACGGEPEVPPPAGGDQPILLIDMHPGFSAPAARWALPTFVLLGDGTAIAGAADQGIVLTARRRVLTAEQVAALYRRADDAGLLRSREYRQDVLDAGALVVRITTDRATHETSIVNPSPPEGGGRGRALRFVAEAARAGVADGAYPADRVAVIVVAGGDDTTDVRPWPLAVPAARMPGYPGRPCLIVPAAEVAALRGATPRTRWSADGKALSLLVRPLLPYEERCEDL
jgi:hypothetical protein